MSAEDDALTPPPGTRAPTETLTSGTRAALQVPGTSSEMSRRKFMGIAGAGVAGAALYRSKVLGFAVKKGPSGEVTIWDRSGDTYEVFDTVIPLFNKVYPNIKINHVQIDVDTKLPPTLSSGVDLPDGSFYEDINIVQVQEDLHDLRPWIDEYLDHMVPFKRSIYTFGNRVVAVPWDFDPMVLWYREDVCEKAGVDMTKLTSFDDLTKAARAIKDKVPSASGPIFFDAVASNIQGMVAGFGNQLHTPMVRANGQPNLENSSFLKVLDWMDQVEREKLASNLQGGTTDEFAAVNSGSEVIIPSGTYYDYLFQFQATTTAGKWRVTLLPPWTPGGARSGVDGGSGFIVPAKAKQPYLAFLWFAFLNFNRVGYTAQFGPNKIYPQGLNTVLPSYLPALDAERPLFKPFKAVGYQNVWAVFTEAAKQVPGGFRLPTWYNQAATYFGSNIELLMAGKMKPDQVLVQSTKQIKTNIIR